MLFDRKKKQSQKQLDSAMLAINSMLRDIYSNKSSDEYKMKGDITKSPNYTKIEEMIADLKTLKGYGKQDADDITKMFHTLHRPVFRTMVKEYIMEQNDKNTLFTATYTVGYRILVGELTRIYAATEATDKGIVYKPDKLSRKSDASRMIKIYNDRLEQTLNKYVQDMKKYNVDTGVNEAYLAMVTDQMFVETDAVDYIGEAEAINDLSDAEWGSKGMISSRHARTMAVKRGINPFKDPEWKEKLEQTYTKQPGVKPAKEEWAPNQSDKNTVGAIEEAEAINDLSDEEWGAKGMISSRHARTMAIKRGISPFKDPEWKEKLEQTYSKQSGVKPVKEDTEDVDTPETDTDGGDDAVQEAAGAAAVAAAAVPGGPIAAGLGKAAAGLTGVTGTLSWYGTTISILAMSVAIIAGLFHGINALFKGLNPVADINNLFMKSYEKKINQLSAVSRLYDETKAAYEEYMKNPATSRSKKVESKYLKNMEKYNIAMNNLSAQIEHYNERAKKESAEFVSAVEQKLPTNETKPDSGSSNNDNGGNSGSDDDFQF